jgi:hypothetical protein
VLAMIARFSRWQFPDIDLLHALGTDAASRKILRGGVLYPCQAIFLGPTMPLLPPTAVISKLTERWNAPGGTPAFVAVERSGVMLNEKMTSAERATLHGDATNRGIRTTPLSERGGSDGRPKSEYARLQRSSCDELRVRDHKNRLAMQDNI